MTQTLRSFHRLISRVRREWIGKEVITRYTTKIASNGTFYTDSNGRRWMKRKLNHRASWNLTQTEPVASNYYPVTSSIAIRDGVYQATVVTDRPQGGTSIEDGSLELMVNELFTDTFCIHASMA